MDSSSMISIAVQRVWSLPILLVILAASIYMTIQLRFVQFRYLVDSIHSIFRSSVGNIDDQEKLSPVQAFINTLGANIGNGSLAGVAVAISVGGPGAIIWSLLLTTFAVVLRFAEVFLGTYVIGKYTFKNATGGPMVYMSLLPGGKYLSYIFTLLALGFMLVAGNLAQCNAVGLAVYKTFGISSFITAFFILAFILYIILGGAQRIISFLDKLVPLKVFVFLLTAIIVLCYHYQSVPYALYLMLKSAFSYQAIIGGGMGFALQHSISAGFQQSIFASEAGLGTAAITFSKTEGQGAVKNGIIAMLGVYINVHIVCFLVALCIISSGVWNNGETSTALLISSYETVFGSVAGFIISLLAITFAMSVLVAAAFNGRRCWEFLLSGKYPWVFSVLYITCSFFGTWMHAGLVFDINNLVNALLLFTNMFGLLWFIKTIKHELQLYSKNNV